MSENKITSFISKHKIDVIVIASLLLISILFVVISEVTKTEGAYVEITVGSERAVKYPLAVNATYTLGGGTNVVTVEGGVAYMSHSNCPDHTCENTGKIKYVGQSIICLPNKVTVKVVGNTDNSIDLVS